MKGTNGGMELRIILVLMTTSPNMPNIAPTSCTTMWHTVAASCTTPQPRPATG
jgi:hypothetical protein